MYIQPIRLSPKSEASIMESFSLDPLKEIQESHIFTEAVFKDGKAMMKPIEEQFQVIKDLLDVEISKNQVNKDTKFNPETFVRNLAWKELENRLMKIFGFRNVEVLHWNEQYFATSKDFQSMQLNCQTSVSWRYPIDGLVTDNGFYDSTKSINTQISYSLGIIKHLSAGELTAIFLHELGHNLDPALVDINYTKTNVLSKYLTDRESSINTQEKKIIASSQNGTFGFLAGMLILALGTAYIIRIIKTIIDFIWRPDDTTPPPFDKEAAIKKIKDAVSNDKDTFTRQTNQEAFADNFARMYGYGPEMISGFTKTNKYYDKHLDSRYGKEQARQKIVAELIMASLTSVHKTDMHRAHNLIKEYEADLRDPQISSKVKVAIQEDLNELNKVVEMYLESSDKFSNSLNKMILEELRKGKPNVGASATNTTKSVDKKAALTEGAEYFQEKASNKKPHQSLTSEERVISNKRFGKTECSIVKDEDGYFAMTHRARTKSYPSLEALPKAKVDFVSSTS